MDPQFGVASPSPLFPYSSGDSVDEQNRFVALELREDSSSIVLRNEKLARMVEHRIAVPARKQIDAPSHLDLYDPFNVLFSNPSLFALELDLFQLFPDEVHQGLRLVGTYAPPMADIVMVRRAIC